MSATRRGGSLCSWPIGRFFLIEILLKQSARRALRRRRKRTLVGKYSRWLSVFAELKLRVDVGVKT